MNKTLIYVSLGLALALVVGVLAGSKLVMQQLNKQPVTLSELPSPMADSPECASFIASLPDELAGYSRAELAEPAPAGAAVWQASSTDRITLRCGVDMPLQYNELSSTFEAAGARWIEVADPTPGADVSTFFTVDRSPVVAVTAQDRTLDGLDTSALSVTDQVVPPAPLATLEAGDTTACAPLIDAVPDTLLDGYSRLDLTGISGLDPDTAAAWGSEGLEPLVLRCGVAAPPSYAPGAQLTQINDTPWFEEPGDPGMPAELYALGRSTDIAVSLPLGVGEEALTQLTNLIAENVPAQ